jgi:ketosteroid isomerase-like protein
MVIPASYRLLGRLFTRLRPDSRLRRWILRDQMVSGWAAGTRGDYALMGIRYADDLVYEFNPELVSLGLPARVEGREPWKVALDEFASAWDEVDYRLEFILDLGDRFLTFGRASARGQVSGAEIEFEYCQLIDVQDAIVQRERDFTDWDQALSASGLEPQVLERLRALPPHGVLRIN